MILQNLPENFCPRFHVAGVLIRVEGEILLIQRHRLARNGLRWGLPAGKVDPGESLVAGAVRELYEETGIRVTEEEVTHLQTFHHRWDEDFDFIFSIFEATLVEKTPILLNPEEHEDFAWLPAGEEGKELVEDLSQILEKIHTTWKESSQ